MLPLLPLLPFTVLAAPLLPLLPDIKILDYGKIVELAETEELLNNPVHPYTKRLISSIPVPDPTYDRKVYDINFDELDSLIEKHGSDSSMIDIGNEHYVATHDVKGLI